MNAALLYRQLVDALRRISERALGLFVEVFVVDRKIARLQTAVIELRSKTSADTVAQLSTVSKLEAKRRSLLRDPAEVLKALAEYFDDVTLSPFGFFVRERF